MATYSIKKTNNGEYKEIEKTFVLDTSKFRSKSDTLCFNVLGEENPTVFDLDVFENIMMSQIDQGFMESLEYKDGLLIATTRDGNTIKKYTYDFGWNRLNGNSLEEEPRQTDDNTRVVEKHFVLDVRKFMGHNDTLCFNVLGEENPVVFDLSMFASNILEQIKEGLVESLEFKDGLLITIIRDGNTIKKYTYDMGFSKLNSVSGKVEISDNENTRVVEKYFVLDIDKFKGHRDTLYFNVEGEENPAVYDLETFINSMVGQIEQGVMESLEYENDFLVATINDGKTIRKYYYDLGFSRLKSAFGVVRLRNNDVEEIEKCFVLDIDKYRGHGDTLCFNVEGEENPTVYDLGTFINNMIGQIEQGLMESLEFKDDLLITVINDGKTIKKYTYDLGFSRLKGTSFGMNANSSLDELKGYVLKVVTCYNENPNNALEELKSIIFRVVSYYNENPNDSLEELKGLIYKIVTCYNENPNNSLEELKGLMYKIVSYYNENPNREIMSKQKYIRMILDIMDGDRLPKLESKDEILRVFQVYHANKADILEILLDNVVFYDDSGNVLDYSSFIKTRKLESIKYDILNQMELKMLMFAVANNAHDLYQEYNNNTNIMPVEIQYKYVDENGNEVEPEVEEVEAGTIFSVGRELIEKGVSNIRNAAFTGVDFASSRVASIAKKIKEKRRTR